MLKAEEFRVSIQEIAGVEVSITSYRIGDRFHFHVANRDPGATIARAEGTTSEEAQTLALMLAKQRLSKATK